MGASTYLLLGLLLLLVFLGVEVAICLGVVSFIALYLSTQDLELSLNFISSTAYEALREYLFAVVPLFLLMGEFIARSGVAADMFWAMDRGINRLPGRFAYATVLGNLIFGFVTGTSVASATTFTAIAYPQMRRYGYDAAYSLGLISGSACLGMLIPPSLLMVVWAILTDQSIGHLFLAGIIPGAILALMMVIYIFATSLVRPDLIGHTAGRRVSLSAATADVAAAPAGVEQIVIRPPGRFAMTASAIGFIAIIFGALGGIWVGFFTPTEGAGVGAIIALVVGIVKGMRWRDIYAAVLAVGRSATPLMIIVFTAQLYSRTLSMSGIGITLQNAMLHSGLPPWGVVAFMIGVWFVMGMLIDSISIMLLTVPVFAPVAQTLGLDPIVFALVGILTIEAGLLTPPFGINVYAVKACIPGDDVTMGKVFMGAVPYWIMLMLTIPIVMIFPSTVRVLITLFQYLH
jgi:tripartite ATP-independent transporter DctM subunit